MLVLSQPKQSALRVTDPPDKGAHTGALPCVDIAFLGTNGISVRHGLSTPDSDEAAVKRAMVRAANYVVVAADSSKVGREDFVSFAPISCVDTLITDPEISAEASRELTEQGVEVICAGGTP